MTDRAAALRSLRSNRIQGLPPPPALVPAASPPLDNGSERPAQDVALPEPASIKSEAISDQSTSETTHYTAASLNALLTDPAQACRDMGHLRENLPARPLNVDLTPGVAAAFDEQCRALRVKKKDVVELLLRGWLQHQGRDLD